MKYKAATFDCAQTLLAVDWRPAMVATDSAERLGIEFDKATAAALFDRMLRQRWGEFRDLNLSRDESLADAFWRSLTDIWVAECQFPDSCRPELYAMIEEHIYGEKSAVFTLYDDVVPCLDTLKKMGVRMAVVSNWDISLHKTLRNYCLYNYFECVIASMEEGVEKPDPAIFQIALRKMGLEPDEVVHIGDNPLDDLSGARSAGIKCFLIDRQNPSGSNLYLPSLYDLPGRLVV